MYYVLNRLLAFSKIATLAIYTANKHYFTLDHRDYKY